jgi:hypothetical protein
MWSSYSATRRTAIGDRAVDDLVRYPGGCLDAIKAPERALEFLACAGGWRSVWNEFRPWIIQTA